MRLATAGYRRVLAEFSASGAAQLLAAALERVVGRRAHRRLAPEAALASHP
jgi:hypothetical protein